MEDDKIITSSSKPTVEYSQLYNANFAKVSGNGVLDMAAALGSNGFTEDTVFTAVLGATTTGRSSIKYTGNQTNLFFPINNALIESCCAAHLIATHHLDCGADIVNA